MCMHYLSCILYIYKLQSCICGWEKVTSTRGLKIHQGKKGCLKKGQQGSRIDSYFLRSRSSQSTEVQQQGQNHCLQDINIPVQGRLVHEGDWGDTLPRKKKQKTSYVENKTCNR